MHSGRFDGDENLATKRSVWQLLKTRLQIQTVAAAANCKSCGGAAVKLGTPPPTPPLRRCTPALRQVFIRKKARTAEKSKSQTTVFLDPGLRFFLRVVFVMRNEDELRPLGLMRFTPLDPQRVPDTEDGR